PRALGAELGVPLWSRGGRAWADGSRPKYSPAPQPGGGTRRWIIWTASPAGHDGDRGWRTGELRGRGPARRRVPRQRPDRPPAPAPLGTAPSSARARRGAAAWAAPPAGGVYLGTPPRLPEPAPDRAGP